MREQTPRPPPVLKAESLQPNLVDRPSLSRRFWMLVPLVGIGTGLAAALLMGLLRLAERVAWGGGGLGDFERYVAATAPLHRMLILLAGGLLVGGVALALRRKPGSGTAGGLTAAIWLQEGRLPLLQTVASAALSVVGVGFGASLGREGAPKEAGAAIASRLGDLAGIAPEERRLLVACGAGAGMAAVYNVPFGGALFALEILLGTLSLPLVLPAVLISGIAVAAAWPFLPPRATYDIPQYPVSWIALAFAAAASPFIGAASVAYMRLIVWANERKPRSWGLAWEPALAFAILGALAIPFPQLPGNGRDLAEPLFTGSYRLPLVAALLVLKPLVTAACLGSGAPGGLFTPTLTTGALLGAMIGHLWALLLPGPPLGLCALLGAAAFLGAATQAPISAIVLVLELTVRLDALTLPLIVAVAGAVLTQRLFDRRSIYSARVSGKRP
ncbi:MAG: chloride channel protein [Acetobacteraceae bacterium]|nr:chloride channel protein [Acetobacteraceae bacterium]